MRTLIVSVLVVLGACGGPSSRDIAMAKQARFQGDKLQLFGVMKSAVEDKFKLEMSDETKLLAKTIPRWYTPDGVASTWSPEDGRGSTDPKKHGIVDRSLQISIVAQLLPEQSNWVVYIEPVILRYSETSPKLEPVRPNDPSLPGFVSSKVDQLHASVYEKLKPFEVKSPGGIAPAAAPAGPAPMPDEHPAPPAGEGSAAGSAAP